MSGAGRFHLPFRWGLAASVPVLFSIATAAQPASEPTPQYLYAGSWNNVTADDGTMPQGVYGWRFDRSDGTFAALGLVAPTVTSADSLAASPDGHLLYVTEYNGCICTRSWPFPGAPKAGVAAYRVAPESGALTFVNRVEGKGGMPAEIRVDPSGRVLALANYFGGNIVTFPIKADGGLGPAGSDLNHAGASVHASAGTHPHGLAFSTDDHWLFVADQGLDRVYSYAFDARTAKLAPAHVPYLQFALGEGPRHLSVHPNNRWVYVVTEQGGTVHLLVREPEGALRDLQSVSVVPAGSPLRMGAAQSHISSDGRFLYVNHRPNETIATFAINQTTGWLTPLGYVGSSVRAIAGDRATVGWSAKTLWQKVETGARSFSWDASGSWLASANLGENAITILRRDASTGQITSTSTVLPTPQPSFVLFVSPR